MRLGSSQITTFLCQTGSAVRLELLAHCTCMAVDKCIVHCCIALDEAQHCHCICCGCFPWGLCRYQAGNLARQSYLPFKVNATGELKFSVTAEISTADGIVCTRHCCVLLQGGYHVWWHILSVPGCWYLAEQRRTPQSHLCTALQPSCIKACQLSTLAQAASPIPTWPMTAVPAATQGQHH